MIENIQTGFPALRDLFKPLESSFAALRPTPPESFFDDKLSLSPEARDVVRTPNVGGLFSGDVPLFDRLGAALDRLAQDSFGRLPVHGLLGQVNEALGRQVTTALDAAKALAGDGGQGFVAGGSYLAIEGVKLSVSQSEDGIDISCSRVSIRAESEFAAAVDGRAVAAYAGFAAEVSTLNVNIHIGFDSGDREGDVEVGKGPSLSDLPANPEAVAFDLLPKGDPRRLGDRGEARDDEGYFDSLSQALRALRSVSEALREQRTENVEDARKRGEVAEQGPPYKRPILFLIRELKRDIESTREIKFDVLAPIDPPIPLDELLKPEPKSAKALDVEA
jgi:hypothetical protein